MDLYDSLKRLIPTLGLAAMLLGCGHARESVGKVRLTIWSMWSGPEEQNFLKVLRRYEELHPGIEIENLGAVNDDTKTIRAIVAGVPPDLFTLADQLYLGPLAANHAIIEMDPMFKESGMKEEDFVPASLSLCRFKGRQYAMPFLIDDNALLWNKQAFRAAGLNPEKPPATLEELEEFAVRLTKRDADGNLTQIGFAPVDDTELVYKLFGGKLYDPRTNRVTPDDPGIMAGARWYKGILDKMGGYRKVDAFRSGFGHQQGVSNPFYVGKIAMMFQGEWNPWWVRKFAPQMEYGVAPIPPPASNPERARSTWLGGNMICIPKGSKHRKEAWDLLVWMQTDEAQILFASLMNNVPNRRSALKAEELRTGELYKERFGVFLDLADSPNAGHFPPLPVANLYNAEMGNANESIMEGAKTPEQAFGDVYRRVQRELDRYR